MTFESMQEHMFGLFYVLTEGADGSNDGSKVFSMLLLTIDMLQVVRTLGTIRFGWTVESQALLRWFDLIALITDQLRRWVPYVCFYVLAVVLVIAAMADAIYVVKLFRDGVLAVIWPLRVLRLLVASIVTIVFTTVLDWLLYPVDCSAEPMSLAAWFHGNGSACTPFGIPEIFIAIPTILLAALFIIFSVGTNVFAFNLDPISRQPLAICTGRVEAAWTLFKVAAVLLPFLSEGLSPLASSIIISLFAARVFWYHLRKLPFQCGYSNKLRGGIHAHVLWLCLSGVATSSVSPGWEGRQTLEWVLIAISPLAFVAGVAIVWWRIHTMDRFLNRLHAEYEVSLLDNESASEFGDRKRGGGQGRSRNNEASAFMEGAQSVKSTFSAVDRPKSRSAYEAFFDTEWEVRRAFSTGGGGYVCCRRLLARRDEEDLPFLNFLLGKAIVEHPDCLDLLLFQLVVLRFIFRDTKQANDQQKKILDNKGIRLDRAFHLYAVIRRATQDSVSTSLGQGGSLNAVNLMEFESKMTTARKSHQTCLSLMKKFWNLVLKVEKSGSSAYGRPSPAAIEDMVHCVNDYEVAIEDAKSEYRWLMEKFPESTSVILSYAHFTDTVINDIKAATKLHTLAAVLENEGLNPDEEQDQAMADGVSSVSSENDARSNNFKFMQSWRSDIVGMEFATLRALQTRVMVCVFFILIISSVGFIMMDLVLFSAAAQENVRLIDASGLFRALAVNSVFWLRTLMMAAHSGNSAAAATVTLNNDVAMQKLMKDHAKNFKLINAEDVETFYHSDRTIYTPAVNGWRAGAMNFWNFGTEFGRMSRLASAIPLGEMANNDYTLSQTSEEKRSVMFVHESVFREAVPFFSEMVRIYESKVTEFGSTATTLTVIDAIINALLNIILIVMTLKTVRVITLVQPEVVACRLALSLPRSTGKKLYAYYKAELQKLTALGDEQAEKDQLMAEEDPETTQKGSGEGLQDAMLAIKVGRTSSNGSADSARVPTIDATKIPSPPNDLAGMEPHGGSIVGPGEDSSDQAFSISKHLTNERRTLGAAVSLNLGTPTNALASGGGSRLKSALKRNPSVEYGSFERSQSDPSRGQAAAAPPSPSGGFPAASSVTAVNLGRAVERYSSMDDK
ncbi:hypothetical protein T484DRAFT_2494081 [Baffinella frigidus]|nr:hypothetical protein T484DRAFT_2494081 [Cryptophyta sp. CCMP2293]